MVGDRNKFQITMVVHGQSTLQSTCMGDVGDSWLITTVATMIGLVAVT